MTEKTPWEVLSRIDVTDKIEKKNGLSYLSWAWAWGKLKENYPHAWFRKHEGASGYPYFMDVQGYAFVRVTVGLDRTGDHEVTENLPVLDHRNKPIQGPNAFEVNNALQRCLAKAIAYHGLGHYIYAGEDMPQEAQEATAESVKPAPAPTPAKAPTQPPAASQDEPAATEAVMGVVGPDGVNNGHPVSMVAEVFAAFIPTCEDEDTLNGFYAKNKTAIAYLKDQKPDLHKQVVAAFASRKAEIKAAKA
jgi:hypothetical protein